MKKFIKAKHADIFGYKHDVVLTDDIGLAAALGSVGYDVFFEKQGKACFPYYRIVAREGIDADINRYYQGHLMVNAHLFAENIEALNNIICFSESFVIEVSMQGFTGDFTGGYVSQEEGEYWPDEKQNLQES